MCGVAVCLKNKGEVNWNRFEKMVDIIAHRGPDDRGTFYEDNLALGHRRLLVQKGYRFYTKTDTIRKCFDANEGQVRRPNFTPWLIICAGHWVKLFHVELT